MPARVQFGSFVLAASFAILGSAQENGETETDVRRPMPIYITPFYDPRGLKISVGKHSQALANADPKSIREIAGALKKEKDKLRAEVMYVTAIRLYDLGHKDEAAYWFYTAQYRARLFTGLLDKEKIGTIGDEAFELKHAYNAFSQLAGTYINGYAFGDLATLEKTLGTVLEEGQPLPNFGEVYPAVKFSPQADWAEKNEEVAKGLSGLIEHIKTNADSIKAQRKKNGIEGKY